MSSGWGELLIGIFICLLLQICFAMVEMAALSFNKVRLQWYVSRGSKRAKWLSFLLNHPSFLFGTTLIGVNSSMQFGSEFARRFWSSLGFSPDLAITHAIVVLIFAELSPLFAARRHAEHVAMLGIGFVYFCSILLRPIILFFNLITKMLYFFLGIKEVRSQPLSREELQKAIESREERLDAFDQNATDPVLLSIFSLKNKTAKDIMLPIEKVAKVSLQTTVAEVRSRIQKLYVPFIPVYQGSEKNIVGVTYPRDLLRFSGTAEIGPHIRQAWFITEAQPLLSILKQFKINNQSVAIVLNGVGLAIGIVTLDSLVDEIFGQKDGWSSFGEYQKKEHSHLIDRKISASLPIMEIEQRFGIILSEEKEITLEELIHRELEHHPVVGESIRIGDYQLSVVEGGILGGIVVQIKTIF